MTYLQILRLLERYAWNQPDVHSVVREFTDLNRETAQYAAVVIQDRDGERDLISDQDWITYTWHIGYVDRLWDEKMVTSYGEQGERLGSDNILTNRDDIYSQGIRVINNIIAGLRRDYDLEITTPDRINTFNQRFTAECAGVYMVIAVTVPVSDCETGGVEDMYDTLSQRFTTNGTYHFVPDGKPWNGADIEIDVHPEEPLVTNFTENGTYDLEGEWKDATIGVNVPGEKPEVGLDDTIWVTPYTPRDYNWTPPEGYVYSSAHIEVVCNGGPLEETITSNGSYSFEPSGGSSGIDMYNQVNLLVDVHPSTSLSAYYTENGIYTIADEFNGGRIEVDVFVPPAEQGYVYVYQNGTQDFYPEHPENEVFSYVTVVTDVHPSTSLSETYTSNGTYSIDGEFNGGEVTVAVSSQKPEESLVETITSNGSYNYTPQAGYVFDGVSLSVDVHPSNSLTMTYINDGVYNVSGDFNGGTITVQTGIPKPANNEIYYVSYTGDIIDQITNVNDFGANLVSNTVHSSGKYCVLTFDGPVLRTGYNSFANKLSLKEIYLPDSVTEISQNSFGNTGLQKCIMQNSVTVIKGFAFSGCYALVSPFRISTGCTVIGDFYGGSFEDCTALSTITIPGRTTDIGPAVFNGCSNLFNIIVHPTTPPILALSDDQDYHQFDDCRTGFSIRVPAVSLQAYKTAPGWSKWETHIIADDN